VLTSIIVSTIAFFVASYFIKRWMDENDIPKGMTRNATIFALALAVSYGASWIVDRVVG
jgi:hypothetical protein